MSRRSNTGTNMSGNETSFGFGYFLFQLILLPSLLHAINGAVKHPLTQAELNFTFYLINFLAIICIFHYFLGSSFRHVINHPVDFFEGVVLGAVGYAFLSFVMHWCITKLDPTFVNRNDESIAALSKAGRYLMVVGTVILVPPAEECFYRGLIFHNLYKRSHAAAYLLSIAFFAAVHIVGFWNKLTPLGLVLSFLEYLPGGLCLAWSYARSGTICTPILIHAFINYYGIYHLR